MARFLSPDWFAEMARADGATATSDPADLVLEQIVTGGPDGEVRYFVVIGAGRARLQLEPPADGPDPTLTITSDWPTATAVARGELSTQRALMEGRLRVRGSPGHLTGRMAELAGSDPVPEDVRANTTY